MGHKADCVIEAVNRMATQNSLHGGGLEERGPRRGVKVLRVVVII